MLKTSHAMLALLGGAVVAWFAFGDAVAGTSPAPSEDGTAGNRTPREQTVVKNYVVTRAPRRTKKSSVPATAAAAPDAAPANDKPDGDTPPPPVQDPAAPV